MTEAPNHNDAVAIIRELLSGKAADVRLSARDASTAVSIVQTFTKAVDAIADYLKEMQELAQKAPSPDYSQVQVEEMQKQFQDMAEEINQAVNSTEYNHNKLFTADGKSISIPIGNGSKIDIFAKDFSFDAQGLDLTTDPQNALANVQDAIANIAEYRKYLSRQATRLEEATAVLESEIESAMGIDLNDFKPDLALETASYAASVISEDKAAYLDTQANLTPDEALKLLNDND